MKQLLLALTIIMGLAACKNDEPLEKTGAVQLLPSVASYNNNINSDTTSETAKVTPVKVISRPTKIIYITRQPARTASNTGNVAPVNEAPAPIIPSVTPTIPGSETKSGTTAQEGTVGNKAGKEVSPAIPQPVKKKGWSNATKGAVIGAGTGAIGGAILSKKKGLGAVIGGVVGAAGGYIIGKNMDKKNATY